MKIENNICITNVTLVIMMMDYRIGIVYVLQSRPSSLNLNFLTLPANRPAKKLFMASAIWPEK